MRQQAYSGKVNGMVRQIKEGVLNSEGRDKKNFESESMKAMAS